MYCLFEKTENKWKIGPFKKRYNRMWYYSASVMQEWRSQHLFYFHLFRAAKRCCKIASIQIWTTDLLCPKPKQPFRQLSHRSFPESERSKKIKCKIIKDAKRKKWKCLKSSFFVPLSCRNCIPDENLLFTSKFLSTP